MSHPLAASWGFGERNKLRGWSVASGGLWNLLPRPSHSVNTAVLVADVIATNEVAREDVWKINKTLLQV